MSDHPLVVELRRRGARVGEQVYIGEQVLVELDFAPLLTIEDGVTLAAGVVIILHDSALNNVGGEPVRFDRVVLRQNCYVGANATILCGVEVGAGSIVGAASVVTRSVPAGMVACGNPARVTGSVQELAGKHQALRRAGRGWYLDLVPWRERSKRGELAGSVVDIDGFVRRCAALSEVQGKGGVV